VTIKTLLFLLVLYICLVWVGAAYLHPGAEFRDFGLKWTAIGLIAIFAFIVGGHMLYLWRRFRARPRPEARKRAAQPAAAVHEDDVALAAAIAEADATLAKAPEFRGKTRPINRLPWRLIIGPPGSGKTSLLVNSGLEPQLLSGHAAEMGLNTSTRLCNVWLAKNTVFIELTGRFFEGDPARWIQLLRILRAGDSLPLWRRLLGQQEPTARLAGVIACSELREFTSAAADPQRFERSTRNWHERLTAIGEVFGVRYPVYQVITKCDGISFFQEYFHNLPESETRQILGCTLEPDAAMEASSRDAFAEVESKRLTKAFRLLFQSLAERRIPHLAYENNISLRPAIYEFPRELKRIRSSVIQFLVEVFRPDALRPAALLRGYYFVGIREVEAAPVALANSWTSLSPAALSDADATQMFRSDGSMPSIGKERAKRMTRRWAFISDLFHKLILPDRPVAAPAPVDRRFENYRRRVFASVVGACGVLTIGFVICWLGNRSLLADVDTAASQAQSGTAATMVELRKLDALRLQLQRLRDGGSWWLHFGMYSGNAILEPVRAAYFKELQRLLLNDVNRRISGELRALPIAAADSPYDPVYRTLKTHLTVSSGKCAVEPELVSEVLSGVRHKIGLRNTGDWQILADRQIRFYAAELAYGNPLPAAEDAAAVARGREYLRSIVGVEPVYRAILTNARQSLPKPERLASLAPNYSRVLTGSAEAPAGFVPQGWDFVVKASKEQKSASSGDCVFADDSTADRAATIDSRKQADMSSDIQRLYIREYMRAWKDFLSAYSVTPYNSPQDAVQKLEILSSNRSPLMALFVVASNQTNFTSDSLSRSVESVIQKAGKAVGIGSEVKPANDLGGTTAEITQFFDAVHKVVPPQSDLWVTGKTADYLDGLSRLRAAIQNIAATSDPVARSAAGQAALQVKDSARQTVAQITREFRHNGLDQVVERLLVAPIDFAGRFIDTDAGAITEKDTNGKLAALCSAAGGTFAKFPFRRAAAQDATLEEFSAWFAPETGHIWKLQMGALGQLTRFEAGQWKPKDPAQQPEVSAEMLSFLNKAQSVKDAFFARGGTQPQLTYSLRPRLDSRFNESIVEFELDGSKQAFDSVFQKQFTWPAAAGAKAGAVARIRTRSVAAAFVSHPGVWGVFRMMADAEARGSLVPMIEWKYSQVAERDLIQPAPVRMEFPEFPGGVDIFQPQFFDGLRCPARAVRSKL
jgi:type VI secretion system protein ImpL